MRNVVVNAGASRNQGYGSMSPKKNSNIGGTLGRAALIGAVRTGAARADELWTLVPGFALVGFSIALLFASAPDLWPHLFAAH
jgi:hypothetical protein